MEKAKEEYLDSGTFKQPTDIARTIIASETLAQSGKAKATGPETSEIPEATETTTPAQAASTPTEFAPQADTEGGRSAVESYSGHGRSFAGPTSYSEAAPPPAKDLPPSSDLPPSEPTIETTSPESIELKGPKTDEMLVELQTVSLKSIKPGGPKTIIINGGEGDILNSVDSEKDLIYFFPFDN